MADPTDHSADFEPSQLNYIEERNHLLRDIHYKIVRQAWFTQSHLLVPDGGKVVDMGCGDGALTYTMAVMNPNIQFVGVDKSKRVIKEAQEKYEHPNLEFKIGDVSGEMFEPDSLDAIINSYSLHEVFSEARYNERIIADTLAKQFTMLKNDGIVFIRDYAKPSQQDYVLIEMHDKMSKGNDIQDLSEVDLLIWYSEHAQPKQDPGCGGFFLEELPPRFPKTRLFRLPYKWAYEFIMRKNDREKWEDELPNEYTFYTVEDFRRELSALGARMEYSAPHWDDEYIRNNFEGHFRLLNAAGETIGDPPTSFIAVARKMPERSSLSIKERRIDEEDDCTLIVKTLRDTKNGDLVDVVTRNKELAEIFPYRIDEKGQLYIYLHDGIVRGIANAVRRSGVNIDGREWSGHMLEPICTDIDAIAALGEPISHADSKTFSKGYIGLNLGINATLEKGSFYYPDPNYIDERMNTYFVRVTDVAKECVPKKKILDNHRFHSKGIIREYRAQRVLDAIAVGLIPTSRLELQLLSLMQHLNIKAENWISKDISIAEGEITQQFDIREFLRQAQHSDKRFKEVKGSAGQLRTINSIFVEEGRSQGGPTGIASDTLDFVLSDEKTINTAVVLPITKSMRGDLHAGIVVKSMPVLQRYEGQNMNVSVPSYNIPKEITNYRMLKQFLAEKFGVTPNMILKLGESYFSHVGITPQRIHPFAVAAPPSTFKDPDTKFMPFYQYMLLWRSLSRDQALMTTIARAYRLLPEHMRLQQRRDVRVIINDVFKASQPDFSLPDAVTPSNAMNVKPVDQQDPENPESEKGREKKEKKDKRRKRKIGLRGQDAKSGSEASEGLDDPENLEDQNQEDKKDKHLLDEFKNELNDIKKALDEDSDLPKPKPEEW